MNSILYDVVILPNPELAAKATAASQKLAGLGSLFTLKEGECYPHVSLYMLQLKADDLTNAKELLDHVAAKTGKLDLQAVRYHQTKGFFDAEYSKTGSIKLLQKTIVESLNPIRTTQHEKVRAWLPETTDLAKENYEKYGYRDVGQLYRPHLTLTRFNTDQTELDKLEPNITTFSGQFPLLGIFEMGDNGTCTRAIAIFELQNS